MTTELKVTELDDTLLIETTRRHSLIQSCLTPRPYVKKVTMLEANTIGGGKTTVRRSLFFVLLAFMLAMICLGAAKRDFQTGKLLSVTADERLDEGTTYRWAIFTVQRGDLIVTARGGRVRRHSGDIGQ